MGTRKLSTKSRIALWIVLAITLFLWVVPTSFFGIEGLTPVMQRTIAIFVFTALMWIIEVIPTWTTSVVSMVLMLLTISNKGIGASKVGLDVAIASFLLKHFKKPKWVLLAFLLIIGVFSMFMSNTATAAMMLTFLAPVLGSLPKDEKGKIGLALAIPIAANLGGMGTPIGTPPNALAHSTGIINTKQMAIVGIIDNLQLILQNRPAVECIRLSGDVI